MATNILQVEYAAKWNIVYGKKGAIVLFDFAAAFPSVDQAFLLEVLKEIGIENGMLELIKKLYLNNVQFIGKDECGFEAKAGIRQGCPLSPLLFAIVADVLLNKLAARFPACGLCAFADDTAMVIPDVLSLLHL